MSNANQNITINDSDEEEKNDTDDLYTFGDEHTNTNYNYYDIKLVNFRKFIKPYNGNRIITPKRVNDFVINYINKPFFIPPLIVFFINDDKNDIHDYVLLDGQHRFEALKVLHSKNINPTFTYIMLTGTKEDARTEFRHINCNAKFDFDDLCSYDKPVELLEKLLQGMYRYRSIKNNNIQYFFKDNELIKINNSIKRYLDLEVVLNKNPEINKNQKLINIYYNKSVNKNPNHLENHSRISKSIMYLQLKFPRIQIYNNKTILNYLKENHQIESDIEVAKKIICQIYSEEYLEKIKNISSELSDDDIIRGDTYFSNVTYQEIIDNSVILYNVCYQIIEENIKYAYCLIRPPSHHSNLNNYNGFCIVNHTYLTAKYLHDIYQKRILILDYDVHHGDGTQALVKEHMEDNIYFVSMHCYGNGFYPGTGNTSENNEKVLNIPIERESGNDIYIKKFELVQQYIQDNNVDIIIISNGLDAHVDDPFQVMELTNKFYVYVTKYLKSLDKPLIYILEGGYNPDIISSVSEDIINELQI
jgi:acetoin utilization deacetylase AcuC-like enzyme